MNPTKILFFYPFFPFQVNLAVSYSQLPMVESLLSSIGECMEQIQGLSHVPTQKHSESVLFTEYL